MKFNKYIFTLLLLIFGAAFTSCEDFLDETPNKAGSAYIYHMDQLMEMTGSPDLYLFAFASPSYMNWGITNNYMAEQLYFCDAIDCSPEYFYFTQNGGGDNWLMYTMDKTAWTEDQYWMTCTWTPAWERVYRFNTVLENLNLVEQTTEEEKWQVAGEAYFGRAYYHFLLMVQYCLWNENKPGIGYREGTNPGEIPARETVKYTLEKIYKDLDDAEAALTKAGKTTFEQKTNFRPTVPTVKAFRARVDLYRGNYSSALTNANAALSAHNTLVTFKDDPNYETSGLFQEIHLLDETGTAIKETIQCKYSPMLMSLGLQAFDEYEELFLASATQPSYFFNSYEVPMSESHYNLFDKENDARWIYLYSAKYPLYAMYAIQDIVTIDGVTYSGCISAENQKWLKPWMMHSFTRFYGNGYIDIMGMTTAEMMLIKAECLARDNKTSEAAQVLKDLRKTRFMNETAANNIGGSVQDVLDERQREMGYLWRFFDIKRLNGAENAGISLKRKVLSNQMDLNSVTEMVISADDPRWALPFYKNEAQAMGWAQNEGWE